MQPYVDAPKAGKRVVPERERPSARRITDPFFCVLVLPRLNSVGEETTVAGAFYPSVCLAGEVACALERYRLARGSYPESAEALAPEFLKRNPADDLKKAGLQYRRVGDGFALAMRGPRPVRTSGNWDLAGSWEWTVPGPR